MIFFRSKILKFLALADGANPKSLVVGEAGKRRSGCWGPKNSINFTEKDHQTSLFWFFFWQ